LGGGLYCISQNKSERGPSGVLQGKVCFQGNDQRKDLKKGERTNNKEPKGAEEKLTSSIWDTKGKKSWENKNRGV